MSGIEVEEWTKLMRQARDLGLSKEAVRLFLQEAKEKERENNILNEVSNIKIG